MTASQDIINDLQDELQNTKSQREALLNQLTLLDVRIDKYDSLVTNIDKKSLELIDIINSKILALKQTYDERITANCKSDLIWSLIEVWTPSFTFDGGSGGTKKYYKYQVTKNSSSFTPYRGLKYYQKPLNRDYGSNIITTFSGAISSGSTVLTILDENSTLEQVSQIGDIIIDSLDNPIIFSTVNFPSIIGFGTTQGVGFVTSLVGGISTGSTVFAHYGPGISSVGIDTGMLFECVGIVTSTIVGFGTTTFPILFLNDKGEYETEEIDCNSLILNDPAVDRAIEEVFTVGIVTSYSAVFVSTESLSSTSNSIFTVIRPGDIDTNFDYRQNPSEPLNIGIINSSIAGIGHSISLDSSGNPNQTVSWSPSSSYFNSSTQTQVNPEPSIGGGIAEYHTGTLSWPVTKQYSILGVPISTTIAPEGTVAITSLSSPNTIGYITSYPGVDPNGTLCNQLEQNINNAISELQSTLSQYEPQITSLVNITKALRGDRDRKELQAWSILQALGSVTEKIQRLEIDINSLINTDFGPFETS